MASVVPPAAQPAQGVQRPARGVGAQRERAPAYGTLVGDARVAEAGPRPDESGHLAPGEHAARQVAGVVPAIPISSPASTATPSPAARRRVPVATRGTAPAPTAARRPRWPRG
jgi:hypothetical protein